MEKISLTLSLIASAILGLTGCSNKISDNSSKEPSAKQIEEFEAYDKELYQRLSAAIVEPARNYSYRFERQIVNEFFNYYLDKCGYHNFKAYRDGQSKCNLDEIEKAPYKDVSIKIPVVHVENDSDYSKTVEILILQNYVPNKSIDFVQYLSLEKAKAPHTYEQLDQKRFIDYGNDRYFYYYTYDMELDKNIPEADFNNWRYEDFNNLSPARKSALGYINTFNFEEKDRYK